MVRRPLSMIDFYSAEAPFATEFRRLLHRIRGLERETELKSLLITSAMNSEGKSTISSLFAITAVQQKALRTLIVDCDLRRPNIHNFFGLERARGVSEILIDGLSPKDAVKKTGLDRLDIITSGKSYANAATVFDAEGIGGLVGEMKFYYDLVILDSPPIIPVSDPMLLGPIVDGILLVVKVGVTQKEVARRAVEIMEGNGKKILGVILNNVTGSLPYYYDYDYYGYAHHEKPSEPKKPEKPGNEQGKKTERSKRENLEGKV